MFTVISILDIPLCSHFKFMACTIKVTISHSESYTVKIMWWKAMLNSDADGLHSFPSGFESVAHRVRDEVKPFIRIPCYQPCYTIFYPGQKPPFLRLFVQLVVQAPYPHTSHNYSLSPPPPPSLPHPLGVRVRLKPDGTRWRTGGEVKEKLANGVGSQYSHITLEHGVSSITTADAHTLAASSQLNWRAHWFKRTRPFRRKTKSGFCVCTITFQTHCT